MTKNSRHVIFAVVLCLASLVLTCGAADLKELLTASSMGAGATLGSDKVWRINEPTAVYTGENGEAHWVGTTDTQGPGKGAKALWVAPDGSAYQQEDIEFNSTKTAHLMLQLGLNPWARIPTGNWELRITSDKYVGKTMSFAVQPATAPEKLRSLYEILRPDYQQFNRMEKPVLPADVTLKKIILDTFREGYYVSATGYYKSNFNNMLQIDRVSEVLFQATLKTLKALHRSFGACPYLHGYIVEFYYRRSSTDRKEEKTMVIFMMNDVKSYVDYSISGRDLLMNALIVVDDEKIQPLLIPLD